MNRPYITRDNSGEEAMRVVSGRCAQGTLSRSISVQQNHRFHMQPNLGALTLQFGRP